MNAPTDFTPLGEIGLCQTAKGTPCIGIRTDNKDIFVQTYKGMGPKAGSFQAQLRTNYAQLGLREPAESFMGTAYNVRMSHETKSLVPESKPHIIAVYVRATVADILELAGVPVNLDCE
jgi:hypothetical protein